MNYDYLLGQDMTEELRNSFPKNIRVIPWRCAYTMEMNMGRVNIFTD